MAVLTGGLVDAHCHPVVAADLDSDAFELWCTEAGVPAPPGVSYLDSRVGLAVRRWCPPALGLPAGTAIDEYLRVRASLGWREATRRLLRAAGLARLLVDTGIAPRPGLDLASLGELAGAPATEVVRLESLAEQVAPGADAAGFAGAFAAALADRVAGAVAVKSVVAYRHGLAIPPERPSAAEVRRAAGDWSRSGGGRLTDPILLRFLLWCGVDTGLPVQVHAGFGDRDLVLRAADPALLQPFLAAVEPTGVPVVLLHCYPYHRQAGWLALVYPHVYVDVGLTLTHAGGRLLAEFCELAPFGKVLFSTDAYGLPELYLTGAAEFRHAVRRLVEEAELAGADAERIGGGNARRVYGLV